MSFLCAGNRFLCPGFKSSDGRFMNKLVDPVDKTGVNDLLMNQADVVFKFRKADSMHR